MPFGTGVIFLILHRALDRDVDPSPTRLKHDRPGQSESDEVVERRPGLGEDTNLGPY